MHMLTTPYSSAARVQIEGAKAAVFNMHCIDNHHAQR
jgi:hypothetical protein